MKFRRPRMPRNWRELLTELTIIVVGVMIALGADQVVTGLRLAREAREIEGTLKNEVRSNLMYAVEALALERCMNERLIHLRDKLLSSDGAWQADPHEMLIAEPAGSVIPSAFRSPWRVWISSPWQSALESDAFRRLPIKKRSQYAYLFEDFTAMGALQERMHETEDRLGALAFDIPLTVEARSDHLATLSSLARQQRLMQVKADQMLRTAHGISIEPWPEVAAGLAEQRRFRGSCVQDVKLPRVGR